jgi:soluble cytochrome b562
MMDRIQRLMNEGRMAEAQQLLDELMQMMENMQVTQGQGGQGQQALDQLGDTLREQQDLSDDSFNELNQRQNGQNGEPQEGQGQGDLADQLAQRQQALRDELQRQEGNLPGAGTDEGEAARQSLRDAGRAMDEAADALRADKLGRAIDRQAEAIERLREGMRSLNEALNQQDGQQQAGGQQGQGRPAEDGRQDPLGRREGNGAPLGSDNDMLQGEDAYRRAEELTDEIRRRSSEAERPEEERDYLNRLLDRF